MASAPVLTVLVDDFGEEEFAFAEDRRAAYNGAEPGLYVDGHEEVDEDGEKDEEEVGAEVGEEEEWHSIASSLPCAMDAKLMHSLTQWDNTREATICMLSKAVAEDSGPVQSGWNGGGGVRVVGPRLYQLEHAPSSLKPFSHSPVILFVSNTHGGGR